MLTSSIYFKNFEKKNTFKVKKKLKLILEKKNKVIESLTKNYKNSYNKKIVNKFKNFSNYRLIGIGGSTLGTHAIYDFLNHKIKKNFSFYENLPIVKSSIKKKQQI